MGDHNFTTCSIEVGSSLFYDYAVSPLRRNSVIGTNQFMRRALLEHSKHGLNISQVYKETLRSIINAFSNIYTIDGDNKLTKVKASISNPERPIAKLYQQSNIVLPVISTR